MPRLPDQQRNSQADQPAKLPSVGALLLGLIPFIALCFTVPLWDRIYPTVFGLPFNLFWLVLWILVTPFCMWGAYHFEVPRRKKRETGP